MRVKKVMGHKKNAFEANLCHVWPMIATVQVYVLHLSIKNWGV